MNEGVKLRECTERGWVEPNEPTIQRESYWSTYSIFCSKSGQGRGQNLELAEQSRCVNENEHTCWSN